MKTLSRKSVFTIYGLVLFIAFFIYFTAINPLVIYDYDDWLYNFTFRKPIPILHAWNPIKVFPEFFMPIVSYFGAMVINPLIDNYCRALTIAHGLFTSLLVAMYFLQFTYLFFKRRFASLRGSIVYSFIFILLHFISHIRTGNGNDFLLGTQNVTCVYNYLLAVLINATLVMHFMTYGGVRNLFKEANMVHRILVVIWGYFCLNSNLFSSVVLVTYVGTDLLLLLQQDIKEKSVNLKAYCKNNWISLFIIFSWLVTNALETTGGRADNMRKSIFFNLPYSILYSGYSIIVINVFVLIFEIAVFVLWKKKQVGKNGTATRFKWYIGLELIYLLLLSAAVEPGYMSGTQVTVTVFFYLFIALMACLSELIKMNKKNMYLPLILCGTIILLCVHPGRPLKAYNFSNLPYANCEALMNDLINQFKTAEAKGNDSLVLVLPKCEGYDGNWPLSEEMGERVSGSLYKHKITNRFIEVEKVILSEKMSKEFGIK